MVLIGGQQCRGGPPREVRREPLESEAAGGQVKLRSTHPLQERERSLSQRRALLDAGFPHVRLFARILPKIVELGHVGGTAEDEGSFPRGHSQRHVAGDAPGPGIDGGGELARREVEGPGADDEWAVLVLLSHENVPERLSLHGPRTLDAHEVKYGWRKIGGGRKRRATTG